MQSSISSNIYELYVIYIIYIYDFSIGIIYEFLMLRKQKYNTNSIQDTYQIRLIIKWIAK